MPALGVRNNMADVDNLKAGVKRSINDGIDDYRHRKF